jgi:hypothetical protein
VGRVNVNLPQHLGAQPLRRRIARPVLGSAASTSQDALLVGEGATVIAVLGCVVTWVPPQEPMLIAAAVAAVASISLLSRSWGRFGLLSRAYATFLIGIDAWFFGNALERLI